MLCVKQLFNASTLLMWQQEWQPGGCKSHAARNTNSSKKFTFWQFGLSAKNWPDKQKSNVAAAAAAAAAVF